MKVLVCGGRGYANEEKVNMFLSLLHEEISISLIVHGDATGADALAKKWALSFGVPENGHKYASEYGKAGGAVRNQRMLDEEKPNLIVAFPGGSGTRDMVTRSRAQGFKVVEVI